MLLKNYHILWDGGATCCYPVRNEWFLPEVRQRIGDMERKKRPELKCYE